MLLDARLAPLGPELRPTLQAIQVVVARAEAHDLRIVAWTEHEVDVVRDLAAHDPELAARFEARYANGRAVAERWVEGCRPGERPANGTLAAYLQLIGYAVPAGAEPGQVGDTIRAVTPTLGAGRPPTPRQAAGWTRLLAHNRHDCAGMRRVCVLAARGLDGAAAR